MEIQTNQQNTPAPKPVTLKSGKGRKVPIVTAILVVIAVGIGYFVWMNGGRGPVVYTAQNANTLPEAHNALGFNVVKTLAQQEGNNNVFISPTSIGLALSMAYNGAAGETKMAMAKALQLQNFNLDAVDQQSRDLSLALQNLDPGVQLTIANSLWSEQGMVFQPSYLQTVKDNFNAQLQSLDFNDPQSVGIVNAWVNEKTKGKIPTIVNSFPPNTAMDLINAVYFKGAWTTAFDKNLTQDKLFSPAGGAPEMKPLMRREGTFQYLENNDFQSVILPYGKDNRISMYVFLPKNLSDFTNRLNNDNWKSWMGQYQSLKGTLLFPRFKIEYAKELKDTLTQLGMGAAFSNSANFSLMRTQQDIKISAVTHKTYIEVNEDGTEAAAVTGVLETTLGLEVNAPKPFYMEVNKPFFVAIRDNQTQEILFMGVIKRP